MPKKNKSNFLIYPTLESFIITWKYSFKNVDGFRDLFNVKVPKLEVDGSSCISFKKTARGPPVSCHFQENVFRKSTLCLINGKIGWGIYQKYIRMVE